MRFSPKALSLLILILLSIVGPLAVITLSASTQKIGIAIILPDQRPDNPTYANATVNVLITLNKLIYTSHPELYMITVPASIPTTLPKGTIVGYVTEEEYQELASAASHTGGYVKLLKINKLPPVPAIELTPVKIAVFDNGAIGEITLPDVLKAMGFNYKILENSSITDLLQHKYDLVILPPGSGTATARALGVGGSKILAKFIAGGGGLIGICAGAYAVIKGYNEPTSWLQLVAATLKNWPIWYLGVGVVRINVTGDTPVTYGFKGVMKFIYWNGPVLIPYNLGSDTTLGLPVEPPTPLAYYIGPVSTDSFKPGDDLNLTYVSSVMKGGYAITVSTYGSGRIVLFAVHPELMEGLTSETPKARLQDDYNWRMLWNAIYYVAGHRVSLGQRIIGTWMWPSLITHAYKALLQQEYPSGATNEEKVSVLKQALNYLALELKSYNITDVFLQVKLLSGALIWPSSLAEKYNVPTICGKNGLEPWNLTNVVKLFADTLHKYGIRLHAWIIVWYDMTWGKRDPMYHCAKWYSATKFRPPFPVTSRVRLFNITYQNYIAQLAKDLVLNCDVDGIQLDYIRWPHVVYSFGPRDFKLAREHGINLTKVEWYVILTYYGMPNMSIPPNPSLIFDKYYYDKDPDVVKWFELRRQAVVNITVKVKEAVESTGKHVILSAALMPEEGTPYITQVVIDPATGKKYTAEIPGKAWQWVHYGQHYSDFAREGYWLIPMTYYLDWGQPPSWIETVARYALGVVAEINPEDKVVSGIQAYGGVTYQDVQNEISYAIESGAEGWVYFEWNDYRDIAWNYLSKQYMPVIMEAKDLLAGPLMLQAKVLSDTSLEDEINGLLSTINSLGTPYYKPYLPTTADNIISKTIILAKASAQELLKKLKDEQPLAETISPSLASYYSYVLNNAEKIVAQLSTAKKLSEISQLYKSLIEQTIPVYITLSSASGLSRKITSLDDYTRTLAYKLSSMIGSEENQISQVKEQLEKLSGTITSLETTIKNVVSSVSELQQLNNNVKKLQQELSGSQNKINSISNKVSTLEKNIASLKNSNTAETALWLAVIALIIAVIAIATGTYAVARKH
ncbi:MAG: hypothetical protein GXO43_08590 [Crenarchaeota archaeon]|nr:hypothetical protein [Thermoproteota archaeon]